MGNGSSGNLSDFIETSYRSLDQQQSESRVSLTKAGITLAVVAYIVSANEQSYPTELLDACSFGELLNGLLNLARPGSDARDPGCMGLASIHCAAYRSIQFFSYLAGLCAAYVILPTKFFTLPALDRYQFVLRVHGNQKADVWREGILVEGWKTNSKRLRRSSIALVIATSSTGLSAILLLVGTFVPSGLCL